MVVWAALAGPPTPLSGFGATAPAVAAELSPEPVPVTVVVEGSDPPSEATVFGSPLDADGHPSERVVPLSEGRGVISWPRPVDEDSWTIGARADGYWSPILAVEPDTLDIRLSLWPTAPAVARLDGGAGDLNLDDVEIRLEQPPGLAQSSKQPAGTPKVGCHATKGEITVCSIPRGSWNLRLDVPGFAPRYIWDVHAETPQGVDLGRVQLQRGGSIIGRLVTEEGAADPETAKVSLRPLIDEDRMTPDERARLNQLVRETGITAKGFFQFVGVPAGAFSIEAEQPGFTKAVRSPIEVEAGDWTELDTPIEMPRPLTLSLRVLPATGPYGTLWSVDLYERESSSSYASVASGDASDAGTWDSPPLAEGRYAVRILDQQGNSFLWKEIEVWRGASSIDLEIPVVYVDGRVLLDDEPLVSTVWFGGRAGSERVEAETDEGGTFFVVLPHDGDWVVDVAADDPPVVSRDLEVAVESRLDVRAAEVTIEVPNSHLTGTVVDEAGLPPVPAARVELVPTFGGSHPASTQAGPRGEFEIVGLAPGSYAVEASSGEASADATSVEIREDMELSLHLVVRPKKIVVGRVVAENAPVPYAWVTADPLAGVGRPPTSWSPGARTDTEGRFRFGVPAGTDRMRLVTMAPGFGLDIREIAKGSTLLVELSRGDGALTLPPEALSEDSTGISLVMVDGFPIGLPRLRQWASLQGSEPGDGGALAVPGMPAGRYALCRMEPQEALLVYVGAALPSSNACTEGFLTPGGDLRLEVPGA